MLRNRKGVTLIEIMTVVVLVTIVMAVTFPAMKDTRRAASMQSARTQVESYLTVARSVAIRNGVRAFLIREGNTLRIMADSTNGLVTVVPPIQLDSLSHIVLSTLSGKDADTVIYDNRGLAVNLDGTQKIYLTVASGYYGEGMRDSICVTRLGLVLDRKCGLSVAYKPPVYEIPTDELPPVDDGTVIDETIDVIEETTGPITSPITDPLKK
jgi:prepilin-type N-terminal cleavage/methylation domain-containing protein